PANIEANKPNNWFSTGSGDSCPFSSNSHGFRCTDRPATQNNASNTNNVPSSGNYKGLICPSMDNGTKNAKMMSVYYNGCYNSWQTCTGATCRCTTGNASCSCTGTGASKTCTVTSGYEHTWRPSASDTYSHNALVLNSGVPYATP